MGQGDCVSVSAYHPCRGYVHLLPTLNGRVCQMSLVRCADLESPTYVLHEHVGRGGRETRRCMIALSNKNFWATYSSCTLLYLFVPAPGGKLGGYLEDNHIFAAEVVLLV